MFCSVSSEEFSVACSSASDTSSSDISKFSVSTWSSTGLSTSGFAVSDNSARSSWDTWIFSGVFLALLDGSIGVPDFEISPLYKLSKSSPISSSSSTPSSTCSHVF